MVRSAVGSTTCNVVSKLSSVVPSNESHLDAPSSKAWEALVVPIPTLPLLRIVIAFVTPLSPTLNCIPMLVRVFPVDALLPWNVRMSLAVVPPMSVCPPDLPARSAYWVNVSEIMVVKLGTPDPLVVRNDELAVVISPIVLVADE